MTTTRRPAITTQPAGRFLDYFGREEALADPPKITQVFRPGQGWVPKEPAVPATLTMVRHLGRSGVQSVSVTMGDRTADFSVREVLDYANRPIFGGNII